MKTMRKEMEKEWVLYRGLRISRKYPGSATKVSIFNP
jgi:hypothetical protein